MFDNEVVDGFSKTLIKALMSGRGRAWSFAKAKQSFDKLQEFIDNFKFQTSNYTS